MGRDVLVGTTFAAVLTTAFFVAQRFPILLGLPAPVPNIGDVAVLVRTSRLLADVVSVPISATLFGLGALLLFLVLRFLTRRDLPAAVLLVALLTVNVLVQAEELVWLMLPLALVFYASYAVLLLRFGVLSAIAGVFTADILIGMPLLPEPGRWTGSATVVIVPLLILLAVRAFRSAVGGTAPFPGRTRIHSMEPPA